MVKLIANGWDPTVKDRKLQTPADYAADCRDKEPSICQELQDILGKPEILTLDEAESMTGELATLKSMVPSQVSPNASVAMDYYRMGNMPLLTFAIREICAYFHRRTRTHICTEEGRAVIQYLIAQGADPNAMTDKIKRTDQRGVRENEVLKFACFNVS